MFFDDDDDDDGNGEVCVLYVVLQKALLDVEEI